MLFGYDARSFAQLISFILSSVSQPIRRDVWRLALPMILAGISTPLLGLVDTAVIGHLDSAHYLGAVAIGALVFNFLFWGFGFLRMGTSGLTAQAWGAQRPDEVLALLYRAVSIGAAIGVVLVVIQTPVVLLAYHFIDLSPEVAAQARIYFDIRIWSAPAALVNYVLLGWFLGIQRPRYTLMLLVGINLINIVLDLVFVVALDMRVAGVAWASLIAEYSGVLIALWIIRTQGDIELSALPVQRVFSPAAMRKLLAINFDIFVRTLCLIFSFAFFTAQGAKMGTVVLAANAVLMNFQTFMAYALDGFAHAAEALVGKYLGARDLTKLRAALRVTGIWSVTIAAAFALLYAFAGEYIIRGLTGIDAVVEGAMNYLPWLVFLPVVSVWSYWFDGIFVGAAWSRQMRNAMVAALLIFLAVWYLVQAWDNHGLWFAFVVFMSARGALMAWMFARQMRELGRTLPM